MCCKSTKVWVCPPKGVCGSLCVSRNVDIWLLPPPITPPALLKGLLTEEPKIQCRKPCHDQMGENGTTRRYVKMLPDNMGEKKCGLMHANRSRWAKCDKKCGISGGKPSGEKSTVENTAAQCTTPGHQAVTIYI